MTWLVTHDLGSDDEVAEELTDEELLDTVRIMLQEKEAVPDGYAMLIRRADYLESWNAKTGFHRGNLTLIQGGLAS